MSKQEEQLWVDILQAIRDDDEDQVKKILSTGGGKSQFLSRKTSTTQGSLTALHLAVKHGNENIIKLLLERGADVNAIGHHGCTALHIAVDKDDNRIIKLLLSQKDIDVDTTDEYGHTAIKLAADKGNSQTVQMLVEKGADMTKADSDLNLPKSVRRREDAALVSDAAISKKVLNITLLASEWGLCTGGLSTINRKLAIQLAKYDLVNVTLLVPQSRCCRKEKRDVASCNIAFKEVRRRPGYDDPLDWLIVPPDDLSIDIVVGLGAKLGKQAQVIREYHRCKWVQVIHTAPEQLGMYKNCPGAIAKAEKEKRAEIDLCKLADLVVPIGPKLNESYSSYLRLNREHQDIIQLTPGVFHEFTTIKQATQEGKFKVLVFGRGDSERFNFKGYDIAAKAVTELQDTSYCLVFVGAPIAKQDEVTQMLLQTGIAEDQLFVREFVRSKEELKELFCEVDLAIMPSRTEGFELTALEALSAGLPILVSGISGFAHALRDLPFGNSCVVDSKEPKNWAKAIASVRQKGRAQRLDEIQVLRTSYDEKYSWEEQCETLIKKMWSMVQELKTSTVTSEEDFTDDVSRPPSRLTAEHKLKILLTATVEFEAKNKECVRVLPYSDDSDAKVQFYVFSGKSGVPQKLKLAAQECFKEMEVKLEWLDLYNDSAKILNVTPVEFSSGKANRLSESQVNEINEIISKNLQVLVRHRNITAVQASFKITKSKQTNRPCIAIYVLRKGFIPDGEVAFPPTLGAYPVDVVNGFWFRTDDPWTPNKAQKQSEVLCLGASIGVKGEEASGTLGAIVEDHGKFYALSCDHVMKDEAETQIIHPGMNDYLNYLNYHLQQYGKWIEKTMDYTTHHIRKSQFSFGNVTGSKELSEKFQELKSIKESFSDLLNRAPERKQQAVNLHEKAFEDGLTAPRVIGKYITGVSRNVTWTDDKKYYIDAALALLTPEEVKSLRQSQTAEIIGTGDSPSGKCSSSVSASRELCKGGRTTEFTNAGRHVNPSIFLNSSLYEVNAQNEQLVIVLKRVKLCQNCTERSAVRENLVSTCPPCESCAKDTAALCDSLWLKNCLCIDHADDIGRGKVFAAKGDSGAILFERDADESLLGFGIIFGEHRHSHKLCTLASPLQIALETLSKEISEDSSLRLLSIYDCDSEGASSRCDSVL